jgi:hypothetical protein
MGHEFTQRKAKITAAMLWQHWKREARKYKLSVPPKTAIKQHDDTKIHEWDQSVMTWFGEPRSSFRKNERMLYVSLYGEKSWIIFRKENLTDPHEL